jgi:hypothetical protein
MTRFLLMSPWLLFVWWLPPLFLDRCPIFLTVFFTYLGLVNGDSLGTIKNKSERSTNHNSGKEIELQLTNNALRQR